MQTLHTYSVYSRVTYSVYSRVKCDQVVINGIMHRRVSVFKPCRMMQYTAVTNIHLFAFCMYINCYVLYHSVHVYNQGRIDPPKVARGHVTSFSASAECY